MVVRHNIARWFQSTRVVAFYSTGLWGLICISLFTKGFQLSIYPLKESCRCCSLLLWGLFGFILSAPNKKRALVVLPRSCTANATRKEPLATQRILLEYFHFSFILSHRVSSSGCYYSREGSTKSEFWMLKWSQEMEIFKYLTGYSSDDTVVRYSYVLLSSVNDRLTNCTLVVANAVNWSPCVSRECIFTAATLLIHCCMNFTLTKHWSWRPHILFLFCDRGNTMDETTRQFREVVDNALPDNAFPDPRMPDTVSDIRDADSASVPGQDGNPQESGGGGRWQHPHGWPRERRRRKVETSCVSSCVRASRPTGSIPCVPDSGV